MFVVLFDLCAVLRAISKLEGLQAALDYASYSGIKDDDAHVQSARQVLKEVMVEEERREKALEVLRAACAAQCIEELQLALEDARSASVRASHLADAEDQLNQLRLERANPQAARRNEAEKHLKKELKVLAELLAQAAYKGVRDAVEPLCSSAFVDKAVRRGDRFESLGCLGRRLQFLASEIGSENELSTRVSLPDILQFSIAQQ